MQPMFSSGQDGASCLLRRLPCVVRMQPVSLPERLLVRTKSYLRSIIFPTT
jgi:hypothetical protein